jgi:hypothetical protein
MDPHHQQSGQTPSCDTNVPLDPFATPTARRMFPVATPAPHGSQHARPNTQPVVGGSSLTLNSDGGYDSEVSVFSASDAHQSQAGSPTPARSATKREGLTARLRAAKTGTLPSSKKSDGISAAQYGTLKKLLEAALGKLEVQELRINQLQEQSERGLASEQRNWKEFEQAWDELNGKALHNQRIRLEQGSPQLGQDQGKDREKGKEKEKEEAPSAPRKQEKEWGKEPRVHQPQLRARILQRATTAVLIPPTKHQAQPSISKKKKPSGQLEGVR